MGRTGAAPAAAAAPACLARYERALDDLEQMVQLVASEHPGTPVFLAASSWAAKLAVVYAAQRPGPLSGLVLLAPACDPG